MKRINCWVNTLSIAQYHQFSDGIHGSITRSKNETHRHTTYSILMGQKMNQKGRSPVRSGWMAEDFRFASQNKGQKRRLGGYFILSNFCMILMTSPAYWSLPEGPQKVWSPHHRSTIHNRLEYRDTFFIISFGARVRCKQERWQQDEKVY